MDIVPPRTLIGNHAATADAAPSAPTLPAIPRQYRQGDVLLQPIPRIPAGAKLQSNCVAWGGGGRHEHVMSESAKVYWRAKRRYVRVPPAGARLEHVRPPGGFVDVRPGVRKFVNDGITRPGEHAPVSIAPGCYVVVWQRQYTPAEVVRVED